MNINEDRNNKPFSFLEFNNVVNSQYVVPTTEMIGQGEKGSNDESGHMKMKFHPNLNVARSYDNGNSSNNVSNTNINNSNSILVDIEKNFKANDISSSSSHHQTQRKSSIHHHHDKKEQITYQFTQDTFKHPKRPSSPSNPTNTNTKPSSSPQTLSSIITSIKSTDPTAYTPILLPFTTPTPQQQQSPPLLDDSIYLLQFPRQIPINLPLQDKIKKEETITDEPQYDTNGYLIQPEYQNIFKQLPNHTSLGKLTLYKSGKIKITIGNVTFHVTEGIKTKFAQQLSIINTTDNKAYILGEVINKKLIVIPEFDI
jgi:hypothetical protein